LNTQFGLHGWYLKIDPTVDSADQTACWKFPPFRDLAKQKKISDKFDEWPKVSLGSDIAITERRSNPSAVHFFFF